MLHARGTLFCNVSSQHHKNSLTENTGKPVERIPKTYKEGLFLVIESEHIKTVCCNVMSGGTECQQPEKSQGELYVVCCRDEKGNTGKSG